MATDTPIASSTLIQWGQEVLAHESDALMALRAQLDASFSSAVEAIDRCQGRLITTGIGKSGHIAKKISATFSSLGVPSFFVHASEASHGDLGVIQEGDTVLALSNSGGTRELHDIIYYCHRFSIPLIAMVGKAPSPLAEAATICLLLPPVAEASDVPAPTTSTTMMLALGDALAVAIQRLRGFTHEHFVTFHPGGKLGASLKTVQDSMHCGASMPLCSMNSTIGEAIAEITAKRFGCTGVVDSHGQLIGIITDGDIRRHVGPALLTRPVGEVMTPHPRTLLPNALIADALRCMEDHAITALFVCNADRLPLGILNIHDCLHLGAL